MANAYVEGRNRRMNGFDPARSAQDAKANSAKEYSNATTNGSMICSDLSRAAVNLLSLKQAATQQL
ncbi:hypothetical protein SPYCA_3773 (plasmid) [Sphingopyxis sp. FD7]|jgi:hypothetical protein|nr:hypothetical protein SPYCA_3773 [Sphingopyxis sp. FD7]